MDFIFDKKIASGYYSSSYFNKTKTIIEKYKHEQTCCMQFSFFGKEPIKVCGIGESVALIKSTLNKTALNKIKIFGKKDGDIVNPKTSILLIIGPYQHFGYLENVIDGILARRSSVCNNCFQILKIIKSSQLIYMADRTDDYLLQPYDGYAAYIAGVRNFVTEASISLIKNKDVHIMGTMPHALIQQYNGDLNAALEAFIKEFGAKGAIALIDYHNDIESEIQKLVLKFDSLFGVRVDTSANIIDKGLLKRYGNQKKLYGINSKLILLTRQTLDKVGFKNTKIVVSSAINVKKVKEFVKAKSSIDYYGIGSSLITRNVHFTADLVLLNNCPQAKFGRKLFTKVNKLISYI